MAETLLNRARLNNAQANEPFSKANTQSQVLMSGVVANAPLVALAYSFAVLDFEGNSTNAGNDLEVECNGITLKVTLDADGKAELSLLPFIRDAVLRSGMLDNPLHCDAAAPTQDNGCRGYIDVSITETNQSPMAMRIYYIFGNYAPKGEMVTDLYFDYDANGGTWVNVDDVNNYTAAGVPSSFEENWCDINKVVESEPTGDFVMPMMVAWYYGKGDIRFDNINYHFRYDCRTDKVVKVRWLDPNGNINVRKFSIAGRSHGASVSNSWQRQHNTKEIVNGYDHGRDEWASITPSETMTLGDDGIPTTHYDWLKTLASTAAVEAYIGGAWVRCNVGDTSIECDPRKAVFSVTLSLILPTDNTQEF